MYLIFFFPTLNLKAKSALLINLAITDGGRSFLHLSYGMYANVRATVTDGI